MTDDMSPADRLALASQTSQARTRGLIEMYLKAALASTVSRALPPGSMPAIMEAAGLPAGLLSPPGES